MKSDQKKKLLEDAARALGEHFDAVQILACSNEEAESMCYRYGSGSYHARLGMMHEEIDLNRARVNQYVRKNE